MTQRMTPEQVREKYGPMFCKGLVTMVDEHNGIARIIEVCSSKGPSEWDIVNRKRTGGIIESIGAEGTTIVMDTIIGKRDLRFGPASSELGGQGISALWIDGDTVHTVWKGIAGASVGVGACLPQAPGVIETIYPDKITMGGAKTLETEIVTPKMVRVIIGVDDTDTPEQGASWVLTMKLGKACPYGTYLDHKIVQLNPKAPNKTTNCCGTAVSFAVREDEVPKLIEFAKDFLKNGSYSDDTVMAVYTGLAIPEELAKWSWDAKSILFTIEDAEAVAERTGVKVIQVTGRKGTIGAVAALGCFDMGLKAAGVPEDFE